ncbi:helix-turn-helix transcriptional regulator [Aureibacillus halotolerans]|uniref:Helix-turn-helix protein n=1 Tax=Aureibacillus halotolerans TaxID=1508390 RepID=A0A4R6U892_9BACI|nr:AraC family transcriptional regulator [Aureibacillus halotolerans]TDQ40825.1 helix-turn-helix protein [Aureibacillus halotolerans]
MSLETYVELQIPPLPYYLGSGYTEFESGDTHPHRTNLGIYDLIIATKGELFIGENHQQWTLRKGDALLLQPVGEHFSVEPCKQTTAFFWLHFEHPSHREHSFDSPFRTSRPFANPYTLKLPKYSRLTDSQRAFNLMNRMLEMPIESSFWEEQHLMAELLAILELGDKGGNGSAAARLAMKTATYIHEHYQEKITNSTLASALHFHPNYIVRCMKMKYNRTPVEYLNDFRIERAKRLLITTVLPIERIAEKVGFLYPPYFSASFKLKVGKSPLQFRNQYLN